MLPFLGLFTEWTYSSIYIISRESNVWFNQSRYIMPVFLCYNWQARSQKEKIIKSNIISPKHLLVMFQLSTKFHGIQNSCPLIFLHPPRLILGHCFLLENVLFSRNNVLWLIMVGAPFDSGIHPDSALDGLF